MLQKNVNRNKCVYCGPQNNQYVELLKVLDIVVKEI